MSKRSQEKRRARSKEKKLARRRMMGISPLARLAGTAEEACECWMNCSPDERMISLTVLRPVRGGETVAALLLIDRDCVGLKDAFYRLDVDPVEVREGLRQRSHREDMRVIRVDLAEARSLVAAAIRWTRAHPFRVPADAERCLKIMGGVGEIDAADISDFGDENGNLFYVGREVDLVRCLGDITLEEFMDRKDVKCVFHFGNETFGDDEGYRDAWENDEDGPLMEADDFDDEDAEATEEDLLALHERMKHKLTDGVRRWCFSKAVAPHPELEAAVDLTIAAATEGLAEADEDAGTARARRAEQILHSLEDPEKHAAIAAAQMQVKAFMDSFPSREAYFSAMGLDDLEV